MRGTPSLLDLPREVLSGIIKEAIKGRDGTATALLTTSRATFEATVPVLYADIRIDSSNKLTKLAAPLLPLCDQAPVAVDQSGSNDEFEVENIARREQRQQLYVGSIEIFRFASLPNSTAVDHWLSLIVSATVPPHFDRLRHIAVEYGFFPDANNHDSLWSKPDLVSRYSMLFSFLFAHAGKDATLCVNLFDPNHKVPGRQSEGVWDPLDEARDCQVSVRGFHNIINVLKSPPHLVIHNVKCRPPLEVGNGCKSITLDFGEEPDTPIPFHHYADQFLTHLATHPNFQRGGVYKPIALFRAPESIVALLQTDKWIGKLGHVSVMEDIAVYTGQDRDEVSYIASPKVDCRCQRGE